MMQESQNKSCVSYTKPMKNWQKEKRWKTSAAKNKDKFRDECLHREWFQSLLEA